jgi:hypothetical protein
MFLSFLDGVAVSQSTSEPIFGIAPDGQSDSSNPRRQRSWSEPLSAGVTPAH